jgi:hypothetical protein
LRAEVSGNYKEVSRERRRRCRGPPLTLATTTTTARQVSLNLTAFLLVL